MFASIQKKLFSQSSSSSYLIPILLLIGSFTIYSYNLEGQPRFIDEITYLSWGGNYFGIIMEGDFDNPCLKKTLDCESIFYKPIGHEINYTPVRNFLVGFGEFLTTGENDGNYYTWSRGGDNPGWTWNNAEYLPSPEEYASGRFFSPIFGSLTIVLAFLIGTTLFNRTVGLFFSLTFLFYGAWMIHSRLIMSEAYLHFFILLSILLLLKSFNKDSRHRKGYFISGAISFGIAFNIKIVAIELVIPILVMILFYYSFNEKLNFRFFKNKKNVLKVFSLVTVFFVIASISFLATFPKFYDDPINEIFGIMGYDTSENVYSSPPTLEKNYLFQTYTAFQVTLFPYLLDPYFNEIFPDQYLIILSGHGIPFNYSTIPLTLFFFVGLIYIIKNIKTGNIKFSEFALLVWFASLFIFNVLTTDYYHITRLWLPNFFPIVFIASYGLWRFVEQIQNKKEKILFSAVFLISHSLYLIPHLNLLYFKSPPSFVTSPFPVNSQFSLTDPLVYVSTITFVMIFILTYLRIKMLSSAQTRKASSLQN